MNKPEAIIFGCGSYYEKKKDSIEDKYQVIAFLDNMVKEGVIAEKNGLPVFNPMNKACYEGKANILLASNKWFEMWEQLIGLGIEEERIVFGCDLLPCIDPVEQILQDEKIRLYSQDKKVTFQVRNIRYQFEDVILYKKAVRDLFAKENSYAKLIADLPLEPSSRRFGQERGTAIDRFYIEKFLSGHRDAVHGVVMEIAENRYARSMGKDVEEFRILHVNGWGEGAVKGNLETGEGILENSVDCMICTQTIPFIYDIHSVIRNIYKLLKPNGTVLLTASAISQLSLYDYKNWGDYWRFTDMSMRRLLEEVFDVEQIEVCTYGNMKAAIAFLYGMCLEEMKIEDLEYVDEQFPMIVAAGARKGK